MQQDPVLACFKSEYPGDCLCLLPGSSSIPPSSANTGTARGERRIGAAQTGSRRCEELLPEEGQLLPPQHASATGLVPQRPKRSLSRDFSCRPGLKVSSRSRMKTTSELLQPRAHNCWGCSQRSPLQRSPLPVPGGLQEGASLKGTGASCS